jgi:hypothetical protein
MKLMEIAPSEFILDKEFYFLSKKKDIAILLDDIFFFRRDRGTFAKQNLTSLLK